MKQFIYQQFLRPVSRDQDSARREFILNVLVFGLGIISFVALVVSVIDLLTGHIVNGLSSFLDTIVFFVVILVCRILARLGWYKIVSYALLLSLGYVAVLLATTWSFELPMAELAFALTIIIAGVLLSARAAVQFAGAAILSLLIVAFLQLGHHLHPRTGWLHEQPIPADAIGYSIILCIIALISWLANREIDRSLKRARTSEAALAVERDSLEVKVAERTRELEQTQLLRLMEVQRFAEFGRLGANLLHEVANPLTAVSLNLEELRDQQRSKPVLQAYRSLQHLERYLTAARKQLKGRGDLTTFSVHHELAQLKEIILPNAKKSGVSVTIREAGNFRLYGDAVKFNQLMSNLLLNAIEAYAGSKRPAHKQKVEVTIERATEGIVVTVHDWGRGIASDELPHIFEPFYSTKPASARSMGIGLAMVKQYVTNDFEGSITVTSAPAKGTEFVVQLRPHREKP